MLIEFTSKGLYCRAGDFFIDPWKPVNKAVITHAHSDHARAGSYHYLYHPFSEPLMKLRLGEHSAQLLEWNEPIFINGVKLSLHPAGHVIGSSQVRIEYQGEVWVISGDYKTEDDGLSGRMEVIPCHTFVTESTFGLPIYHWKPQATIYRQIQDWVTTNHQENKTSILFAYSIGKAQRVIDCVASTGIPVYLHGAIYNVHLALQAAGWKLPNAQRVWPETNTKDLRSNIVIAPGSAQGNPWLKRFNPYVVANCSGWMQVRGHTRRANVDAGFVLSDHADWHGLWQTVKDTVAQKVYVTHGFQSAFSRYLKENGIDAEEVKTEYGEESTEVDGGEITSE